MRRLEFGPLAPEERGAVARVLHEAFTGDEPLLRQVQLVGGQMAQFWDLQVSLFGIAGATHERSDVLVAREDGRVVAAVVFYEEGWRPQGDALAAHLDAYRRAFGLRALTRYLRFSAEFGLKAASPPEAMRLQSLGVANGLRGQGTGSAFLDFLHRDARARGRALVQLEVRTDNPARDLYLRLGYAAAGRITVCGVEMDVLRKSLR